MISKFAKGIGAYRQAWSLLTKHSLWSYVWIPGLISLALGGSIAWAIWYFAAEISAWLISWYPFDWGKGFVEGLLTGFSGLLFSITGLFLFKYLVMMVVAPFMGPLSEKTESLLTNSKSPKVGPIRFVKDLIRGLRIVLRNLVRELVMVFVLGLLAMTIVPAVLIFFVQSYYAGFGHFDYTLERKRYNIQQSVAYVYRNKWLAMGVGAGFISISLIPVIGWFFAPTLSTIAATVVCLEEMGVLNEASETQTEAA